MRTRLRPSGQPIEFSSLAVLDAQALLVEFCKCVSPASAHTAYLRSSPPAPNDFAVEPAAVRASFLLWELYLVHELGAGRVGRAQGLTGVGQGLPGHCRESWQVPAVSLLISISLLHLTRT